jgi:Tfp pilus assembly PilM family ATPase
MARIFGIDLGAHSVKIAEMEGGFGRFQIVGYRERRVPEPEDGPATQEDRIAALDSLLSEYGDRSGANYGAGFPSEHTSVRVVTLPFGDRSKVEQALGFEVEGQVPFDLEDMVLSSRILQIEPGNSKVLAAMAERERVSSLLGALDESGADPKVLIVDADLLSDQAGAGVQAVIDLGHVRTVVCACRDHHAIAARAINAGGRDLTLALAKALDLDFASAEARKHQAGVYASGEGSPPAASATPALAWSEDESDDELDMGDWTDDPTTAVRPITAVRGADSADPTAAPERLGPGAGAPSVTAKAAAPVDTQQVDANGVLRDAILPLLLEIRTTLVNMEDTHDAEIAEVVLCGGGAELGGLREWLGAILGVPVRVATVSELASQQVAAGRFAIADAAARRAGSGKGRMLDMRQGGYAFKGDLEVLGSIARYASVAVVAFLVAAVAWTVWQGFVLNSEIDALDDQISKSVTSTFPDVDPDKVRDPTMAVAIMLEKTLATSAQVEALGSVVAEEPPITAALRDLSAGVPPHTVAVLDVSEVNISAGTIIMKAETGGFEDAGKVEAALQKQPKFSKAHKGDEKKRRDKVSFTITVPLADDDTEEG